MGRDSGRESEPRVSVVIPCYNGERYLGEAIQSVLDQGIESIEILVVDDGSTDSSLEVARGFGEPVRAIARPHLGASSARNHGIGDARGALLAFLDADDLWTPGRLSAQLAALDSDPGLDLVMGHTEQFVSPEIPEQERQGFRLDPASVPARLSGALLVRRPAFDRVGGFAPQWETGEFIDWYLRAEELGLRSQMLPQVVLRRRLHRSNHGIVRREARQNYVSVIKAALDRRRAADAKEA